MTGFELLTPASEDEAVAQLHLGNAGETVVLAGGTDLLLDLDDGRYTPRRVISLRRLPWRSLDLTEGHLRVGSTLPLRALEMDPEVRRQFPALYQGVRAVGGVALRHRATLGGNVVRCAPASDLLPVLLALDAEIDLVGPAGGRTVPIDRFLRASRQTDLKPGELVRSVLFPEARPSAYLWQRVRPANDISQVAVAAAFAPGSRRWRVAVGGVTPRPALLEDTARSLGAGAPEPAAIDTAADRAAREAAFPSDQRASEEYRRRLLGVLLRRAIAATVAAGGVR